MLVSAKIDAGIIDDIVGREIAAAPGDPARALRNARRIIMLAVMERDLAGIADLSEVTQAMSSLADRAIAVALDAATRDLGPRYGVPHGAQSDMEQLLHVAGMGKLGGRELNVSSDIDLIFLYPEEGSTRGGMVEVSNQEYIGQVGKRLIATLSDINADG
jgi:glutamate-ammonia-ligase adenylyltransferase